MVSEHIKHSPFQTSSTASFISRPHRRHLVGINCSGDIWKDDGNSGSIDPMAGFLKCDAILQMTLGRFFGKMGES